MLLSVFTNAYGQNQALLEKEAAGFYQKKDYNNALTAYRQLLAKDQLNPNFNFHYGHCLYEVADQNEASKYFDLILANQLTADPLVYYYRARIYQHQYFFSKAIQAFEQYEKLTAGQKNAIDVSEFKKQCLRGNAEFKNFQTLPFQNTREVALDKFYFKYPFSDEGYSIYEAADVLPKYNAKKGYVPIYCYRRAMKYRIVAAYDGTPQLDLFIQKKDASNNWASLIKIEGVVNTSANEAFGFYDEETQTLYYSSQANSIGGYDLYKAQLDLKTGLSTAQERLSYPYSSPDDDFLYVIDRVQEKVFFASKRAGIAQRCEIYSLALGQEIQQPFIFSGTFFNQQNSKQNTASLTFVDLATQTTYGPFLSESDGSYLVVLPQKGSFQLNIQLEGASAAYQSSFVIPGLKDKEQLRQQVIYEVTELGKEKYTVINSIIPADLEQQVELLAKAQVKLQGGALQQTQFSNPTALSARSPLLDRFTWPNADTTALLAHLTDSLLAAEVSLENQVRLTEVLRKDFEQKLAQREQLLSKGSSEELDQVNKELAFIKNWLSINQAANIPNLEILHKIQQTNEQLSAWQHTQQEDSILKLLETLGEQLSTFLQIAAFDGEKALDIEQQKTQLALAQQIKSIQTEKQNLSQIQAQIQAQEKSLDLQSKKEQLATQQRIAQLKKQQDITQANMAVLEQQRAQQEKYLLTFDQDILKEIYLARSERQDLPRFDLTVSMEELLSQYEQQEVLLKELAFVSNKESISNEENPIKEEVASNQEIRTKEETISNEGNPIKEGIISNQVNQSKEEVASNQVNQSKEETTSIQANQNQEEISSNQENQNKEQYISNLEHQNNEELTTNQELKTKEETIANEGNPIKEEVASNQVNQSKEEVASNQVNQNNEELTTNQELKTKEETISNEGNPIKEEVASNQVNQTKGEAISNGENPIKEAITSNQVNQSKEEVASNQVNQNNEELTTIQELKTKEETISNEGNPIKEEVASNQVNQSKEETTSIQANQNQEEISSNQDNQNKEQYISNLEHQNNEELTTNQELKTKEETISNEGKLEAIQRAATQLKEDEGELLTVEIPTFALKNENLEALENELMLPVADKQSEAELVSEQWEAYMVYLEQRDSMERLKERISLMNKEIKDIELAILEAPSEELGSQLLVQVQAQQAAIAALQKLHVQILAVENQPEFEALLALGYLPPYELISSSSTNASTSYSSIPSSLISTSTSTTSTSTSTSTTSSSLTNLPFEINKQANLSSIPIGLPCPQGLVFRVQVGAFRKPIPAGKFTEFSPVDGRVLANGLTVVMAGYFSSSAEALKQRNIIRGLGYADAFIVAYNGCERMSFANAVQLEAAKQPNGKALPKSSIFETPGEALYYTVQVGVYNRPLQSEKQLGLPELIEAQTAKGQFRYASGRFDKLAAAKERQRLAVVKGITDAFIVAYYQGKRISLAEAKQLLAQGVPMDTKSTKQSIQEPKLTAMPLAKVPVLPNTKQLKAAEQFVRYEIKCSDCTEKLAQLNKQGVFTFVVNSDKISSAQFNESDLTTLQRYYFKRFKMQTKALQGPFQTVAIKEQQLNGAQMDWLLRQASPYRLEQSKNGEILISVEIE